MVPEIDIHRAANPLVKQHGEFAPLRAAERAGRLLEAGDVGGERAWPQILKAVEGLLAKRPAPGQRVHWRPSARRPA